MSSPESLWRHISPPTPFPLQKKKRFLKEQSSLKSGHIELSTDSELIQPKSTSSESIIPRALCHMATHIDTGPYLHSHGA